MAGERFFQGIYYDNLGISYSAGTLTIHGANGRDLSSANPAVVVLPSKANPGLFTRYNITANQSFEDSAGTSDIIGTLFGWTTSIAITVDVPFFIYAVANDDEDDLAFMICRIPGITSSPTNPNWIGQIGTPPVTNNQTNFFSLKNITVGDYNGNPCFCLGSFRMKMDTSDDWTVQTLISSDVFGEGRSDGFGMYKTGFPWQIPLGQLGANSGTLLFNNGGTAPVFTTNVGLYYFIGNTPNINLNYYFSGDGETDGSGAVTSRFLVPLIGNPGNSTAEQTGGPFIINITGFTGTAACIIDTNQVFCVFYRADGSLLNWADFGNGGRTLYGSLFYKLLTS